MGIARICCDCFILRISITYVNKYVRYAEYQDVVMPDGKVFSASVWTPDRLAACTEFVANNINAGGKDVVYKGPMVSAWIFQAVENALAPHRTFLSTPNLDYREVELAPVPIGAPIPEAGLEFEVKEDGDNLYLCVICDDPGLDYHNYDINLLIIVKAPPILAGKNLFLRVRGSTIPIITFAKTYQPYCRNLFIWAYHDNFPKVSKGEIYGCAYSSDGTFRPGDKVEMSR